MPGSRRGWRTAAAGALAALLLGACGTQVAGQGANDPVPHTAGPSTPIAWTTAEPSQVTGVSLSGDRRTLTVQVQVPSGEHPCVRDLKAVLTEPPTDIVRVQVTFSSPSFDRASGCTREKPASTQVHLPAPLTTGQRLVVDNYDTFTAEGAALPALRLCGKLGCTPPATGCTDASYDQALLAVAAPAHTYRDSEDCDGNWLVLDFSWRTGPACGDSGSSACTSRLGDRYFFRAEPSGWVPLTSGAAGGCGSVHKVAPDFPTAMCASLPPLSAQLHPVHTPAAKGG
ncbi:hypothetical protein [Actinacidiphila bryophytorum]|uniref:Integral membrane protein n=1 Tax=Actinacidiphila bryophytorum TaxID=1436133 RepID=A0A9W4E477_9ACTN|nr:hypothetical protein [Actinacidiphila bryophytorum]MBM9438871.1 hypothetical protein [Actinacidiphila bryophytorum]MBN6542955.1 hypothetical protein [Actinacidiphila bryophytorum]CAG7615577.1 conserved exported hypothetical protein [Actinacidiphila bryophytorum]